VAGESGGDVCYGDSRTRHDGARRVSDETDNSAGRVLRQGGWDERDKQSDYGKRGTSNSH